MLSETQRHSEQMPVGIKNSCTAVPTHVDAGILNTSQHSPTHDDPSITQTHCYVYKYESRVNLYTIELSRSGRVLFESRPFTKQATDLKAMRNNTFQ
jgi:hypothetical protein